MRAPMLLTSAPLPPRRMSEAERLGNVGESEGCFLQVVAGSGVPAHRCWILSCELSMAAHQLRICTQDSGQRAKTPILTYELLEEL